METNDGEGSRLGVSDQQTRNIVLTLSEERVRWSLVQI